MVLTALRLNSPLSGSMLPLNKFEDLDVELSFSFLFPDEALRMEAWPVSIRKHSLAGCKCFLLERCLTLNGPYGYVKTMN